MLEANANLNTPRLATCQEPIRSDWITFRWSAAPIHKLEHYERNNYSCSVPIPPSRSATLTAASLTSVRRAIVRCERCPRLRSYCARVAREKKREFLDWTYCGRPVPGFGDAQARLMVVGLAPAAHGGNRTGRVFTGDSSGDMGSGAAGRRTTSRLVRMTRGRVCLRFGRASVLAGAGGRSSVRARARVKERIADTRRPFGAAGSPRPARRI